MVDPSWVPEGVSRSQPSAARMYDYFLGGYHNFAIDRETAERTTAIYPEFPLVMRTNRAFLRRAVRFLVGQGIDQFLDLGSGIPTVGNVHEVAQTVNPNARVVYVDVDPIAVAHSKAILEGNPRTFVLQADVCQPEPILQQVQSQRLLDFDRPLALLLAYLLHFLADDAEAVAVVAHLVNALPSGSYLVLSHGSSQGLPEDVTMQLEQIYARTSTPVQVRTYDQILALFAGLPLVEPGLVYSPLWRPESQHDLLLDHPERSLGFAGVAIKSSGGEGL